MSFTTEAMRKDKRDEVNKIYADLAAEHLAEQAAKANPPRN